MTRRSDGPLLWPIATTRQFGRFRSEADIQQVALAEPICDYAPDASFRNVQKSNASVFAAAPEGWPPG